MPPGSSPLLHPPRPVRRVPLRGSWPPDRARRIALATGLRAVAPALIATGAWGLVTGVVMVRSGLTPPQALGMTLLVFAGSAQLAALPLMVAQAPVGVILLAATVVNLRFVIFSAGLQPHFRHLPPGRRLLLGYLSTDFGYALFVARQVERRRAVHLAPPRHLRHTQAWFFLGTALGNWCAWQAASVAGIVLAGVVPVGWGLEFAAILALIALTVPMIRGAPAVVGAASAAAVAVAASGWPLKLGLLAAVLVGVAAAMAAEGLGDHRSARSGRPR